MPVYSSRALLADAPGLRVSGGNYPQQVAGAHSGAGLVSCLERTGGARSLRPEQPARCGVGWPRPLSFAVETRRLSQKYPGPADRPPRSSGARRKVPGLGSRRAISEIPGPSSLCAWSLICCGARRVVHAEVHGSWLAAGLYSTLLSLFWGNDSPFLGSRQLPRIRRKAQLQCIHHQVKPPAFSAAPISSRNCP